MSHDAIIIIERRKVKHVRLEYGVAGLKVIIPLRFTGDVEAIVHKHAGWIRRREQQVQQAQTTASQKPLLNRTDQTLRMLIRELMALSETTLGSRPQAVKYRSMRSRWGSCSSVGVITFSTKLKHLPDTLVAFVVHHEMSHLKVMRHDKNFWGLMERQFPHYKALRKELLSYGMLLR